MIEQLPPWLCLAIGVTGAGAWLAGRTLARRTIAHLVESAAAYGSGALVMVGPAIVLLVALR